MFEFSRAGGINSFVNVTFDLSTRSISCLFLNQSQRDSEKQCIANVTYGANCDQHEGIYLTSGMGNSVTTPPLKFTESELQHCLFVTAISGNTTVIVEQKLSLINTGNEPTAQPFILIIFSIVLHVQLQLRMLSQWL